MDSWQVNRIAVADCAKAVSEALRKLGKRCSVRWVNRQCEPPQDVARSDYYGAFRRWFEAIFIANRDGAEFLFEDFCAFVQSMRDFEDLANADLQQQFARCEGEHSDIIRAALLSGDTGQLQREIVEDIAEKQRLLAMIRAREMVRARAA
jgi:hypothetical protein